MASLPILQVTISFFFFIFCVRLFIAYMYIQINHVLFDPNNSQYLKCISINNYQDYILWRLWFDHHKHLFDVHSAIALW